MNIQFAPENRERRVQIKVVGVGGAGGNAVNRMIEAGLTEVDFFAVNTDAQALETSRAHQTLVIGSNLTRGLGAGGDPVTGRAAAEEDRELLAALVDGADMGFVTAGMGGGPGTGAAPVVAEVARQAGALTVAIVTRPFLFEGLCRMEQAEAGLAALREHTDALLVIPNERLMDIDVPDGGMTAVFRVADNVLYEATRGISDIIAQHAVVNLDFADVRTVMKDSGAAIMGTGRAAGPDRALVAAGQAISSPLLENVDIYGSRAVLVYLTARSVTREDLRGAMGHVQQAAGATAHIFFGFANDESLGEDLQVTVIATGFPVSESAPAPELRRASAAATAGSPVARASEPAPETIAERPEVPADVAPAAPAWIAESAPLADTEPVFARAADPSPESEPEREPEPGPESAAMPEPLPEPIAATAVAEPVAEPAVALAALAAAAGGRARLEDPAPEQPTGTETSRRFLDPLGSVSLRDQTPPPGAQPAAQRFRSTVLGDDKLRPAWERKYVD